MIQVDKIDDTTFSVTVKQATATTHKVTLDPAYYRKLAGGRVPAETLIEKSFEFLLQRESNTSILRTFDLPVIGHYFPDYESAIVKML
jgi:hypothetical protein